MRATRADRIEDLYREHGDRLWWAVLAYSGDREVANDAVAEAFAQVLRRGDDVKAPLPWLWKAAFRIAAGELQRRGALSPDVPETPYTIETTDRTLIEALRRLSAQQRVAVVLHYYADRPLSDVAAILGCSAATAAVHVHRARLRLRELLGDDDDG